MEISLPDEHGRHQILNIHTTRMKEFKKIADDVDMKVNYLNIIYYYCYLVLGLSNLHVFYVF